MKRGGKAMGGGGEEGREMLVPLHSLICGGMVALWLVGWPPDQAAQVWALAGDIVCCTSKFNAGGNPVMA